MSPLGPPVFCPSLTVNEPRFYVTFVYSTSLFSLFLSLFSCGTHTPPFRGRKEFPVQKVRTIPFFFVLIPFLFFRPDSSHKFSLYCRFRLHSSFDRQFFHYPFFVRPLASFFRDFIFSLTRRFFLFLDSFSPFR